MACALFPLIVKVDSLLFPGCGVCERKSDLDPLFVLPASYSLAMLSFILREEVSLSNNQSESQTYLAARGRDLRRRERRRWSCARCRFGVQHAWTNRATCQWRVATRFAAVQLIEATSHCTPARAESLPATARRAQRHTRRPSLKTFPAKSVSSQTMLLPCSSLAYSLPTESPWVVCTLPERVSVRVLHSRRRLTAKSQAVAYSVLRPPLPPRPPFLAQDDP